MYLESPISLNFFILYLFLVNSPQALYINPGFFKYISGINLSLINKILFTMYSFYTFKIKNLLWDNPYF